MYMFMNVVRESGHGLYMKSKSCWKLELKQEHPIMINQQEEHAPQRICGTSFYYVKFMLL